MAKQFRRRFKRKAGRRGRRRHAGRGRMRKQAIGIRHRDPPSMLIFKGLGDQILPPKFRVLTKCGTIARINGSYMDTTNEESVAFCVNITQINTPFLLPPAAVGGGAFPVYPWGSLDTVSTIHGAYPSLTVTRPNGLATLLNLDCYQAYRTLSSRIIIRCQPTNSADICQLIVVPFQSTQDSTLTGSFGGYISAYAAGQAPRSKKMTCVNGERNVLVHECNVWDIIGVPKQNYMVNNSVQHRFNTAYSGTVWTLSTYDAFWQVFVTSATTSTADPSGNFDLDIVVEYYVQLEALNLRGIVN